MKIEVENLGKKFRNEWIFRGFSANFESGNTYAVVGANGSGKSTLLQALSSYIPCNKGVIKYFDSNKTPIEIENIFRYLTFTSPFLELIEDFTLLELINFHTKLKPLAHSLSTTDFLGKIELKTQAQKQVKFFSSGMKQKVKLGLCLFSEAPILFLDEPTTNLDQKTKSWFLENIVSIKQNKLIILASNDSQEYSFTNNIIDIQQFK
jgi:ABC-type multidrug transport system ATPase subunit